MSVTEGGALDTSHRVQFRRAFSGEVVLPGDTAYETRRKVWNGLIDKRPGLIASCTSVDDVIAAVQLARGEGLTVAVRGGGHSFPGFSTCDDGLVIDLSPMKQVDVDPERRVARVQGGVSWGELDAATHAYGLATTGGLMSTTGIAGLTLGGGIGWLMRKHGLACDNLLAVDMVTANGDVVHADSSDNPELLWALRGGGGNFGIVTDFVFRLHPVDTVLGGLMLFAAARTPEVLRFYRDYVADLGDECTTMLSAITAPAADFVPPPLRGEPAMAVALCHCGDPEDGAAAVAPLRELRPDVDLVDAMPYPELQQLFDEDLPHGIRCYLKAGYVPALTDAVIDVIAERTRPLSAPYTTFDFHHMGGAVARVDDDTAFGGRRFPFCFNIVGLWHDPAQDELHTAYVREFSAALAPFSAAGVYVNFTAEADMTDVTYSRAKLERLRAVKREFDPTNLFRLNQNVRP
jgi:FAD/FMN-containing dehydrogenase